jgi:predicted NBD/HSP70 family sugar kinase
MPERKQFNAKEVFERADEGDSLAQSVIDEVSAKLHL